VTRIQSEAIAKCYEQAHRARVRAKYALDPQLKINFRITELRWLMMARRLGGEPGEPAAKEPSAADPPRFPIIEGGGPAAP
jgi:hypothetical protein